MDFYQLILIGIATGIIAGMLGLGGGIIFTPVLLGIFEAEGFNQPHLWAVGTSLACTFVTAIASSIRQQAKGNFDLKRSGLIGLFAIIGLLAGKQIVTAEFFSVTVFRIVYAVILGYVALQFIFGKMRKNADGSDAEPPQSVRLKNRCALITGASGGFIATLAGIGGGGVMVPIMHFGFNIPLKKSVSLSSGAIVLISFFGALGLATMQTFEESVLPYALGYVELGLALPLSIGAFMGGFIGVQWSHRLKPAFLSIMFGTVLAIMFYKVVSGLF
jgi:uncharacterized membrane protein YfcA